MIDSINDDWRLVSFDLTLSEHGFLLERNQELYGYDTPGGRRVPVFGNPEAAALFARQVDASVKPALALDRHYDADWVIAFTNGGAAVPPHARDAWTLLLDVGGDLEGAETVDDALDEDPIAPAALELFRTLLKAALAEFRGTVIYL